MTFLSCNRKSVGPGNEATVKQGSHSSAYSETVEYPNTLELYDAGWKCFYQLCFFSRVLSGSLSVQVSLEVGSERFSRPLAFEVMPKLQY